MENAIPQVQIMAEILGFCKHPQTKAQMMHNVDFSLDMLKKYLHFLGTQELLEIHYSREE